MTTATLRAPQYDAALYHQVQQFLYREARLQDTHSYDEWEALWDDNGVYWIPANGHDIDPDESMSLVYDNRSRIRIRVEQLKTGRRYTQTPPSALARIVSNVEIVARDGDEITVCANTLIREINLRGETTWATRNEYVLRPFGDTFKMARKKVGLVNSDRPIFTLSFLV